MFQIPPLETSTKFMVGGVVGLTITVILFFMIVPHHVDREVLKQKGLSRGSFSRQMWEKFPEPFDFNVYIFNVTNPAAVTLGARATVQEIGPFAYDEYKWKTELRDRESDDTVAYRPESWWYFNQNKSKTLTGNEMVTVPNPVLLGIVTMIERDMSGILGMINAAVKEIFRHPTSVFMTVTVRQLMFDGVTVNCSVKELGTKAVCAALGVMKSSEIKKTGKDIYTFSFLGGKNGTYGEWHRVVRGTRDNGHDVGKMVEFKRKSKLSVWTGRCNHLTGTDGTIFPPLLTKETQMFTFAPDICRSLPLKFVKETVHRGVQVYRYTSEIGDIANDEEQLCFCRSNATCPKKGTLDLTRCTGSPIIASLPHFYLATSQYQSGVVGLKPDKKKHQIFAELEPVTGTPLMAMSRLQFNIELHKVSRVTVMKKLQTTMHPILWVEEGITVPQKYIDRLDTDLFSNLRLIKILSWLLIIIFVGLIIYGTMQYRKRGQVTPVATPAPATLERHASSNLEKNLLIHSTPELSKRGEKYDMQIEESPRKIYEENIHSWEPNYEYMIPNKNYSHGPEGGNAFVIATPEFDERAQNSYVSHVLMHNKTNTEAEDINVSLYKNDQNKTVENNPWNDNHKTHKKFPILESQECLPSTSKENGLNGRNSFGKRQATLGNKFATKSDDIMLPSTSKEKGFYENDSWDADRMLSDESVTSETAANVFHDRVPVVSRRAGEKYNSPIQGTAKSGNETYGSVLADKNIHILGGKLWESDKI